VPAVSLPIIYLVILSETENTNYFFAYLHKVLFLSWSYISVIFLNIRNVELLCENPIQPQRFQKVCGMCPNFKFNCYQNLGFYEKYRSSLQRQAWICLFRCFSEGRSAFPAALHPACGRPCLDNKETNCSSRTAIGTAGDRRRHTSWRESDRLPPSLPFTPAHPGAITAKPESLRSDGSAIDGATAAGS